MKLISILILVCIWHGIYTFLIFNCSQIKSRFNKPIRFNAHSLNIMLFVSSEDVWCGNKEFGSSSPCNKQILCSTQHANINVGIKSMRSTSSVVSRLRNLPFNKPNDRSIAIWAEEWQKLKIVCFTVKWPLSQYGTSRCSWFVYAASPIIWPSFGNFD